MIAIRATHEESRAVPLDADAAAARFAEIDRQIACHPELDAAQRLDDRRARMKLREMSHGPVKFAGEYVLAFALDGTTVTWTTETGGNLTISGSARFDPAPGGCTVHFRESVAMALPVNRVVGVVVRPVAEAMMARGMRNFVERVVASLPSPTSPG